MKKEKELDWSRDERRGLGGEVMNAKIEGKRPRSRKRMGMLEELYKKELYIL